MSRSSVVDKFFKDFGPDLAELELPAHRVYNIDETWSGAGSYSKKKKVLAHKGMKVPYQVSMMTADHITLTMCVCSDGTFMPPMFTFVKSVPSGDKYINQGPQDACYTTSESGHINTELYFRYIKHLDKHLSQERPIVIFQDNLYCHDSPELTEYCIANGIHLINFPPKLSHIIQPLDKLFGTLKSKLENKAAGAYQIQRKTLAKGNLPPLVKFAVADMNREMVKKAFRITGVYPFQREAIPSSALVADDPPLMKDPSPPPNKAKITEYQKEDQPVFSMIAEDENGNSIEYSRPEEPAPAKPKPVTHLTCDTCGQNNVALHPCVQSGMVDLELAKAFADAPGNHPSKTQGKKGSRKRGLRDYAGGRWITSETEQERRRKLKEDEEKAAREKELNNQKRDQQRKENKREDLAKKAEKKHQQEQKKHDAEMRKEQVLKERMEMNKKTSCYICKKIVKREASEQCIVCTNYMHRSCANSTETMPVCSICYSK